MGGNIRTPWAEAWRVVGGRLSSGEGADAQRAGTGSLAQAPSAAFLALAFVEFAFASPAGFASGSGMPHSSRTAAAVA